ncbi:MAG: sigma 54-interacting transcriptional regulator [Deltaproteobacteria bacterium]|nr:sigma 54-interacting transcriptional regulator [Deltaproteobacteria bacterium]
MVKNIPQKDSISDVREILDNIRKTKFMPQHTEWTQKDTHLLKSQLKKAKDELKDPMLYGVLLQSLVHEITSQNHPQKSTIFRQVLCHELEQSVRLPFPSIEIPLMAMEIEGIVEATGLIFTKDQTTTRLTRLPMVSSPTRHLTHTISKNLERMYFYAKSSMPILIVGETGTSKSHFARALHAISNRREKELVEINCSAIPETMIESELFGHIKGAFTDAKRDKKGLFEEADKGILLLDEMGKMPKHLQAKLLKVIEDQRFIQLGDTKPIDIDVRIIATVQPINLQPDNTGSMDIMPDLLYRLGYPSVLELPKLNEILAADYKTILHRSLEIVKEKIGIDKAKDVKLSSGAYKELLSHNYEGNYRELENILKDALISAIIAGKNIIEAKEINLPIKIDKKNPKPKKVEVDSKFENIKLKDIIDYADKKKAQIIEQKVKEIIETGATIKSILEKEGCKEKEYHNFYLKMHRATGKKIKDMKKAF